jgi:hypothetical protein
MPLPRLRGVTASSSRPYPGPSCPPMTRSVGARLLVWECAGGDGSSGSGGDSDGSEGSGAEDDLNGGSSDFDLDDLDGELEEADLLAMTSAF